MGIHLTRIYTRVGDDGTTALGDFSRVSKTDPRIEAYADANEANAALGVAVTLGSLTGDIRSVVVHVQNDLFDVGADLCAPVVEVAASDATTAPPLRITQDYIDRLEGWCDEFNARLSKLNSFILPGGTPGAALLHQACTVTRRAERRAWALIAVDGERTNLLAAKYLNRLSDLLFILARTANNGNDVLWKPGGER